MISDQVRRSPAVVAKIARSGTLEPINHGGPRVDSLGDEGRLLLGLLMRRFPKMRRWWYVSVLEFMLEVNLSKMQISRGKRRLGLSTKKSTVVYSESLTLNIYNSQLAFRAEWDRFLAADANHANRSIFVDVVGFKQVRCLLPRTQCPSVPANALCSMHGWFVVAHTHTRLRAHSAWDAVRVLRSTSSPGSVCLRWASASSTTCRRTGRVPSLLTQT